MFLRRTSRSVMLVSAVVGSLAVGVGVGVASADPIKAVTPSRINPGGDRQVVLITGDRVTVATDGSVTATPGRDRRGISIAIDRTSDGHVHVMPSDAAALVATGRVDGGLFDVTALAGYGYDNRRADMPLIVGYATSARSAAGKAISDGGATTTRDLNSIGSVAVRAPHAKATSFWDKITTGTPRRQLRSEISGVWLDRKLHTMAQAGVQQIGAPQAWAAGYDGTGVKVGVIDTGIDATHPDLAGKVAAARNFTSDPNANDTVGHGTHVASILAGTGVASNGQYRGVAPGATLLNAKVCSASDACSESAILEAMQWVAQQGAEVVNMSLGGNDAAGNDPMENAINNLTAEYGMLFVVSAGNRGSDSYAVGSPSTADSALSVGAVGDDDSLALFSSRGPRVEDTAIKPDITAPGLAVTAARSSTSQDPGDLYTTKEGTSMAAPHVAGAAAILAQRRPSWKPTQLKSALMGSAQPNPSLVPFQQGAGRLDVGRSVNQTVLASAPSVSLGRAAWPHDNQPVLTRPVAYSDLDASPVQLSLTLTALGPDGSSAPSGMFSLSVSSLTVAAGTVATVNLNANLSVSAADGFYGGYIIATAPGGVRVVTPFAVDLASAGYEVTFTHYESRGAETKEYSTTLYPLAPDGQTYYWGGGQDGPVTQFVAKGDYLLVTSIAEEDGSGRRQSILVSSRFTVNSELTLPLNAGAARPYEVGIADDPAARQYNTDIDVQYVSASTTVSAGVVVEQGARVFAGQLDPAQRASGFSAFTTTTLAVPGPDGTFYNAPRSYHLVSQFDGYLPTGFTQNSTASELARVNVSVAASTANTMGLKGSRPVVGAWRGGALSSATNLIFDLPFTMTEYYSTASDLRWYSMLSEADRTTSRYLNNLAGAVQTYTAGTTVSERWNSPVIGPSQAYRGDSPEWVSRTGDTINAQPALTGDGAGHSGNGSSTSATVVLKRDGTEIASADDTFLETDVPAGPATYRLEATLQRESSFDLSTNISAAWTFRSDTASGATPTPLPLWNVSFLPTLNAANAAPAGRTFAIPATVSVQPGSTTASPSTVSVQYSTDDGTTWRNATVSGSNTSRTVTVAHPDANGFVSLKATVSDSAGNSVEQTIIRAYKIAR